MACVKQPDILEEICQHSKNMSPADPCMLYKQNDLGICIIIMYVDDMLIIGRKEQIQEFTNKIQKEFSVKMGKKSLSL